MEMLTGGEFTLSNPLEPGTALVLQTCGRLPKRPNGGNVTLVEGTTLPVARLGSRSGHKGSLAARAPAVRSTKTTRHVLKLKGRPVFPQPQSQSGLPYPRSSRELLERFCRRIEHRRDAIRLAPSEFVGEPQPDLLVLEIAATAVGNRKRLIAIFERGKDVGAQGEL